MGYHNDPYQIRFPHLNVCRMRCTKHVGLAATAHGHLPVLGECYPHSKICTKLAFVLLFCFWNPFPHFLHDPGGIWTDLEHRPIPSAQASVQIQAWIWISLSLWIWIWLVHNQSEPSKPSQEGSV